MMCLSRKPEDGGGSGTPGASHPRAAARGQPGVGTHSAGSRPGVGAHGPGSGRLTFGRAFRGSLLGSGQPMFASHLWVRAAAVMSGGAEEPSPVKAFLSPLNLLEYRDLLKEPGADVPGVDSPGSGLTRPPAGPGSARGRDSLGLRVAPVRHSL